jgi:hypothetical protein
MYKLRDVLKKRAPRRLRTPSVSTPPYKLPAPTCNTRIKPQAGFIHEAPEVAQIDIASSQGCGIAHDKECRSVPRHRAPAHSVGERMSLIPVA